METENQDITPKRRGSPITRFIDSGAAEIGGAIVTLTSGILTGVQTIKNKFYSNANHKYGFFDHLIVPPKEGESLVQPVHTAGDSTKGVRYYTRDEYWRINTKTENTPGKIFKKKAELEQARELAKKAVLKEKGLNGLRAQWKMLLPHQKWEVRLAVSAVFAVGIGAILAIAGTRNVSQETKDLEARLTAQENHRSPS